MMEAFISTATVLLSYYPVAIPTLLIFSLESASSARLWQASQRVPPSQPNPKFAGDGVNNAEATQQKKRSLILKGAIAAVKIVLFLVIFMAPIFLKDITKLKILYLCILGIPFILFIFWMMMGLSGLFVPVITRRSDGKPLLLIMKKGKASLCQKMFFAIFGVVSTLDAIWFGQKLGVFVVYAALIYSVTRYKFFTTKLMIRHFFYMAAIVGLLSVAMVVTLASVKRQSIDERSILFGIKRLVGLVNWSNIILSSLGSATKFIILSLCYRFDYTNSLPPNFQPEVSKKTNIGFIINYPKHFAYCDKFPRPYFHAALVSLLLSYVVIAVLSANTMYKITYDEVIAISLFIAPQMMSLSILMLAAAKGQFRKLWNYEEDWGATPSVGTEEEATEDNATSALLEEKIWVENEKDLIPFGEKSELQEEQAYERMQQLAKLVRFIP